VLSPHTLGLPQRSPSAVPAAAAMLSVPPTHDAVAEDPGGCTGKARTRSGFGAKPPFLSAPKADLGKQEAVFFQQLLFAKLRVSQFDLIRIFQKGAESFIPPKKPFHGGEVPFQRAQNPCL